MAGSCSLMPATQWGSKTVLSAVLWQGPPISWLSVLAWDLTGVILRQTLVQCHLTFYFPVQGEPGQIILGSPCASNGAIGIYPWSQNHASCHTCLAWQETRLLGWGNRSHSSHCIIKRICARGLRETGKCSCGCLTTLVYALGLFTLTLIPLIDYYTS